MEEDLFGSWKEGNPELFGDYGKIEYYSDFYPDDEEPWKKRNRLEKYLENCLDFILWLEDDFHREFFEYGNKMLRIFEEMETAFEKNPGDALRIARREISFWENVESNETFREKRFSPEFGIVVGKFYRNIADYIKPDVTKSEEDESATQNV